jgi:hypothetical protein
MEGMEAIMEISDEGSGRPQLEASVEPVKKDKNWKRRTRVRTSCLCVYCRVREAHQQVQLKGGTSNGAPSKRWMCGLCILKRQRLGLIKQDEQNAYIRKA